jgi:predicted DNA-binding WGR domain protein
MGFMTTPDENLGDVELRSVDPSRNRFRLYGITECCTLFGELCLRIVWGRIGNRRLRERSEVFEDRAALQRRRDELLRHRRRHGYTSSATPRAEARQRAAAQAAEEQTKGTASPPEHAIERAIVEEHGLSPQEPAARHLVARWHAATLDLVRYLEGKRTEALDLVDVSTLAAMFVAATAA